MMSIEINIKKELALAKRAALEAGKFLIKNKRSQNSILSSTNKDIKLQADISSENIIKKMISSNSMYPMLSEESGASQKNLSETFWVIDPLDGTANYSRDIPLCCVSIALISNFEPVLGVIYDFNNDELYEGTIQTSAKLNKNNIYVSKTAYKNEGVLVTGLPNDTDYSKDTLSKMILDFQNWRKVRMLGSAAIASVYIASGKADLYSEKKTYLWDIAAGAAIVKAAGGAVNLEFVNDKFQVDVSFSNADITKNI